MPVPLRVLIVEDSPDDAELMVLHLTSEEFQPEWQRVQTEADYLAALETNPDLILADWSLPQFSGWRALQLMNERGLDIPFIIVSGRIEEDAAVEAMRQGAADYLLKDRLTRLRGDVRRALDDKQLRDERKQAEESLQKSERRFRSLVEHSLEEISLVDSDGTLTWESPTLRRPLGYPPNSLVGHNIFDLFHPDDRATATRLLEQIRKHPGSMQEALLRLRHQDGSWRWMEGIMTNLLDEPAVQSVVINYRDITERKKAEQTLHESEERFRSILDNIDDGFYEVDTAGNLTFFNPAYVRILGRTANELMGMNNRTYMTPEGAKIVFQIFNRIFRTGIPEQAIGFELVRPDGARRSVETSASLIKDSNGSIIGFRGTVHDITKRKQMEQELRANEQRLASIYDTVGDVIFYLVVEPDGQYRFNSVNPAFGKVAGIPIEQVIGRKVSEIIPEPSLSLVLGKYRQAIEEKTIVRWEETTDYPTGRLTGEVSVAPVFDGAGYCTHLVGSVHDVTERKRAEEALRESEERNRGIIENSPVGIFQSSPKGRYINVNPTMAHIFGYDSPGEMLASITDIAKQIHVDPARRQEFMRLLADRGQISEFTNQNYQKDGRIIWTSTNARVVKDQEGKVQYYEGFMTDITERKQAEDTLRHSQEETAHANRLLLALSKASQAVQRSRTIEEIYSAIQDQVSQMGYYATGFELSEVGRGLRIAHLNYKADLVRKAEKATGLSLHNFRFRPRADSIYQKVLGNGETVFVKNTAQAVADALPKKLRILAQPVADLFKLDQSIFTPLKLGDETIGLLSITGPDLTEADNPTIAAFANQAAIAMQNTRLYEQAQQEITERKQAEEALIKSEGKFRAIFDNASTGMFMVDLKAQKYFMCNNTCAKMLGYAKEEFLNLDIADIHPGEDMPFINEQIGKFSQGEEGIRSDIKFKRKNGSIFAADLSPALLNIADKEYLLISFMDITERKQAEEEIQSRTDELSTLYQLSRVLADASDLENVIELVNRHAVESVRTTFAGIALMEEGDLVTRAFYPVRVLDHDLIIGEQQPITALPICRQVMDKNEPVILQTGSPEVGSAERLTLQLDFAQSVCLVPLQAGDPSQDKNQTLGLLILGEAREEKREAFTPEKVHLAQSIGDQAAAAIRRLMLGEQAGRRLQRLASLSDIDRTIASSFDLHLNLQLILQHIVEQLEVDAADVLILNRYLQTLEFAAGRGFRSPAIERKRLRLGEGQAGQAVLERHIVQIPDVATSGAAFAQPELLEAENVVAYFALPLISKGQVMGVLEICNRTPLNPNEEWFDFLRTLAGQTAIAIDNIHMFESLQQSTDELELAYDATIEGWSHALDLRDKETEGHTLRVAEMTVNLARTFGLGENELVQVRWGGLLHDIGKMGVPDGILLKPGPLTDEEWVAMKKHPTFAYEMLSPIHYLRLALDIPYCHHEKWDGTGYPRGLKGEQIPLTARIFAVVDVYDALTSDRPYRKAWTKERTLDHIREQSGKYFDPKVVEIFLHIIPDLK